MLGDDNKGELAAAGRRQRARQWRAENLTAAVAGELGCVLRDGHGGGGARAAAACGSPAHDADGAGQHSPHHGVRLVSRGGVRGPPRSAIDDVR